MSKQNYLWAVAQYTMKKISYQDTRSAFVSETWHVCVAIPAAVLLVSNSHTATTSRPSLFTFCWTAMPVLPPIEWRQNYAASVLLNFRVQNRLLELEFVVMWLCTHCTLYHFRLLQFTQNKSPSDWLTYASRELSPNSKVDSFAEYVSNFG